MICMCICTFNFDICMPQSMLNIQELAGCVGRAIKSQTNLK